MNTKTSRKQSPTSAESLTGVNPENFDFEVWSREVRRQLLASLQKRSSSL